MGNELIKWISMLIKFIKLARSTPREFIKLARSTLREFIKLARSTLMFD